MEKENKHLKQFRHSNPQSTYTPTEARMVDTRVFFGLQKLTVNLPPMKKTWPKSGMVSIHGPRNAGCIE